MRKYLLLAAFLLPWFIHAQNTGYARSVIRTLCSEPYAGRGYVDQGIQQAASFIRGEFQRIGLAPMGENFYQDLGFPVVSYPDRVTIELDGEPTIPGTDFILNPGCPAISGTFKIVYIDSARLDNTAEFEKLKKKNLRNSFLVVDEIASGNFLHPERARQVLANALKARGLVYRNRESLVWSPSTDFASFPVLFFKKGSFPSLVLRMNITVDASREVVATQNVVGFIKGKVYPDSFLVITAHYDHLGKMGKDAIFPGANDNASGVAMMLDMASWYVSHPPNHSVVFIAFTGEEVGLLGSLYFTLNPLFPLKQISLLLNLDLMSTGDAGLTVVNGLVFPHLLDDLQRCNSIGSYLPEIAARGKAQNSDHYYFSEAGVPALFVYLRGDYHHYHDVDDTYEALTMSRYPEAFRLLRDFMDVRMEK